MKPQSQFKGEGVALVAYRGHHFQGYAVKTSDGGWVCVAAMGMSWTRLPVRTAADAKGLLRTTSHAARFEHVRDVEELERMLAALPPYQQPGITPDQIPGLPVKLRLRGY
jgi:hypothetical protein